MIGSPDFTPIAGYELDGVDQWEYINKGVPPGTSQTTLDYPRKYVVSRYDLISSDRSNLF